MDDKFIEQITKSANKTSARFLLDYYKGLLKGNDKISDNELKRFAMAYDIYIKARSYSILNKIFFWTGIVLCLFVLIWPSLGIIYKTFDLFKSAVIQTTVTGLAALNITIYSHYKKRQLFAENLMRYVVFSEEGIEQLIKMVINEMSKMDQGFSFNTLTKDISKDEIRK